MKIGLAILIASSVLSSKCKEGTNDPISPPPSSNADVTFYLTKTDQSALFALQETGVKKATEENLSELATITIDSTTHYQEIDGFGYCLTGGSAMVLSKMSSASRKNIFTELFDTSGNNIGVSYLRVSIGASDLDDHVFSYDDVASGTTDVNLAQFSLAEDKNYLIPVLKEILAINPNIKLLGSPWSAPVWMKTNNASIGGSLKTEYYATYAQYFVKYIQGMAAEGITMDAVTVQNEPLHDGNNPSMYMPATEQLTFVKSYLGPAFAAAGISTKIIIYDHNADNIEYANTILNDQTARQYVDGSAFHLYNGSIDNLSNLHVLHPDKNLYFTEQYIASPGSLDGDLQWHTREVIIGSMRNWCRVALEWNLAADPNQDPHTDGGCTVCLGALTIDGSQVARNPAYYIVAHASKLVVPGSVRVSSNAISNLPNVAFKTPDGKLVLLVLNNTSAEISFNFSDGSQSFTTKLSGGAVGTFKWDPNSTK